MFEGEGMWRREDSHNAHSYMMAGYYLTVSLKWIQRIVNEKANANRWEMFGIVCECDN